MDYKKNKNYYGSRGMGLVEIIVGSAIVLMVITATVAAYNTYINYALANQNNIPANYLLEEGIEVATYLRDKGWDANIGTLTSGTTYYITFNGSTWLTTTTLQYVDNTFLRTLVLGNVNRDGSDDIATSGTLDPNIKKVTVTVSYGQGHSTTTKSLSTYITDIYDN